MNSINFDTFSFCSIFVFKSYILMNNKKVGIIWKKVKSLKVLVKEQIKKYI
jgi:hypothetical protein